MIYFHILEPDLPAGIPPMEWDLEKFGIHRRDRLRSTCHPVRRKILDIHYRFVIVSIGRYKPDFWAAGSKEETDNGKNVVVLREEEPDEDEEVNGGVDETDTGDEKCTAVSKLIKKVKPNRVQPDNQHCR